MSTGLFGLSGRRVLVTGASGGLGHAICIELQALGAEVLAADRPGAALESVPAWQRIAADLAGQDGCEVVARAAIEAGVSDLVLNAGIEGPIGPLDASSIGGFEHCLEINLMAPVRLSAALLPHLRAGASLVLMSSIAGLRGNTGIGAYAMTKAALAQFARDLAVQWGPRGIRTNAVAPGLIRTPLAAQRLVDQEFMDRRLQATPLRRVGEAREVAGTVAWLLSAAGAFVCGQTIVVDGGTLVSDGS